MADGFSIDEAIAAQRALRAALGLGEETFAMPAFVGMVSDEIEQARARGMDDAAIARIFADASGQAVGADDIARYYAPPSPRPSPGGRGGAARSPSPSGRGPG